MVQSTSVSIPANDSNSNVLSNLRIRIIPPDGVYQIDIAATASATGMEHEVFVGNINSVERSVVSLQNRVPILRDDIVASFQAAGGEEITVAAFNGTGGALTYFLTCVVTRVR